MKKCLLFAAATLAGLASCSQNEIENINNPQDNAIQFGTYLGQSATTKGTETTATSIQASGFGVSAFYTGQKNFETMQTATPDFMYNQKVEYTGAWSYSPIKYWPTTQGDKLSFFAYAPYQTYDNGISLKSENTEHAGAPTLSITLQSPDKMIDFVAASVIDATHDNSSTTHNDKVKFNFQHEMTRVGIQAKVSEKVYSSAAANKTKVVITGIKFDAGEKIYKSAIYTFSATSTGNNTKGTWEDFTKTTEAIDLSSILNLGEVKMAANDAYTKDKAIALEGTTPVDLLNGTSTTGKKYLFLIPVDNLGEDAATATISYDIVTEDANLAKGYSCTSATKKVSLPTGTLAQGKAYTYTFVINVDKVELEANVTPWDTETNSDATVDYPSDDVTASISGIQFPDGTNIGGVTEGNPDDIN